MKESYCIPGKEGTFGCVSITSLVGYHANSSLQV